MNSAVVCCNTPIDNFSQIMSDFIYSAVIFYNCSLYMLIVFYPALACVSAP